MKKYFQVAFLILLGTLLVLCLSSCSSSPTSEEQTKADPAEPVAPAAPAAPPAAAGNGGWLSGIPEAIPQFTHGVFSSQSEKIDYPTQTLYTLYYDKVTIENVREYMGKLKEKGFTLVEDSNVKPGNLTAFGETGAGAGKIGCHLEFQSSGNLDLRITVFKQ